MLSDLVYLNGIIATELTKITENLAAQRHGEEFLRQSNCLNEHFRLNTNILSVLNKYYKTPEECKKLESLEKHVLKHFKEKE